MSNKEYYDQLIGFIKAIPEDSIKEPGMPVDVLAQEAENTYDWAMHDKDELVAADLDPELLQTLPARAGALRHAESNWFSGRFAKEEAAKKWEADSPAAYNLRDYLIHIMLFAYRKDHEILVRVQTIAEGSGHADMIQDLSDLAQIGRKNPGQLAAIKKFNAGDIDKAEQMSGDMARLLAGAKAVTGITAAKIIRDQAYTYLKTALDEVRATGQFVFWKKNKDRLPGYASQYHRHPRAKKDNGKTIPSA